MSGDECDCPQCQRQGMDPEQLELDLSTPIQKDNPSGAEPTTESHLPEVRARSQDHPDPLRPQA